MVVQCASAAFARHAYRAFNQPIGSSAARNQGIGDHGPQDTYFFVDDDVQVPSHVIERALSLLRLADVGVICGQVVTYSGRPYNRYSTSSVRMYIRDRHIGRVLGALLVVRAQVLDQIGTFDERFGINADYGGMEEADLVFRALRAGWRVVTDPAIRVVHPEFWSDYDRLGALLRAYKNGQGLGALIRKHGHGKRGRYPRAGHFLFLTVIVLGIGKDLLYRDAHGVQRRIRAIQGIVSAWKDYGRRYRAN